MKKGIYNECPICERVVYRIPASASRLFCSRQCYILFTKIPTTLLDNETIKLHRNVYVSNLGRILLKAHGCLWEIPSYSTRGYRAIPFEKKKTYVHRLVAEAFIGTIPPTYEVNHKNGVRDDNRISNLEIITRSENMLHAVQQLGRASPSGPQKLTISEVKLIRKLKGSDTYENLGKRFNVKYSTVAHIMRGSRWSEELIRKREVVK